MSYINLVPEETPVPVSPSPEEGTLEEGIFYECHLIPEGAHFKVME
jgi:hypothetical protein